MSFASDLHLTPLSLALLCRSEMKDGVVAFEDEADAERYGELLEADGSAQVSCCFVLGWCCVAVATASRAAYGCVPR